MIAIGRAGTLKPASNATPCTALIGSSKRSSSLFPSRAMPGCQGPSFQAGQRPGGNGTMTLLSTEPEGNVPPRDTSRIGLATALHVALALPYQELPLPVESLGFVQRHQCLEQLLLIAPLLLELETVKGTFSVIPPLYLMDCVLTKAADILA